MKRFKNLMSGIFNTFNHHRRIHHLPMLQSQRSIIKHIKLKKKKRTVWENKFQYIKLATIKKFI